MLDLVAMPTEELVPTSNSSAPGIKISNKVFSWVKYLGCYAIIRTRRVFISFRGFSEVKGYLGQKI